MPYSLSEQQIDFILADIKKRGIEIEKLQINLLDHVCCLLEEKMNKGDDFESCYTLIIEDFHENGMKGLQKETKGLTRSKYHYTLRAFLYIIFAGSLTYNIYIISKIVHDVIEFRQELMTIKDISIEEGYDYLKKRLKEEYPDSIKKDLTCVFFLHRPESEDDLMHMTLDSIMGKAWKDGTDQLYKKMDSLALVYSKNVTFVSAFEKTNNITELYILEHQRRNMNLLYLHGMNRLFSGYNNHKNIDYKSYPTIFVLDKEGKIVYDGQYAYPEINRLSRFLRSKTSQL